MRRRRRGGCDGRASGDGGCVGVLLDLCEGWRDSVGVVRDCGGGGRGWDGRGVVVVGG